MTWRELKDAFEKQGVNDSHEIWTISIIGDRGFDKLHVVFNKNVEIFEAHN